MINESIVSENTFKRKSSSDVENSKRFHSDASIKRLNSCDTQENRTRMDSAYFSNSISQEELFRKYKEQTHSFRNFYAGEVNVLKDQHLKELRALEIKQQKEINDIEMKKKNLISTARTAYISLVKKISGKENILVCEICDKPYSEVSPACNVCGQITNACKDCHIFCSKCEKASCRKCNKMACCEEEGCNNRYCSDTCDIEMVSCRSCDKTVCASCSEKSFERGKDECSCKSCKECAPTFFHSCESTQDCYGSTGEGRTFACDDCEEWSQTYCHGRLCSTCSQTHDTWCVGADPKKMEKLIVGENGYDDNDEDNGDDSDHVKSDDHDDDEEIVNNIIGGLGFEFM